MVAQAGPGIDLTQGSPGGAGIGSALMTLLALVGVVALALAIFFAARWAKANLGAPSSPLPAAHAALSKETRRRINDALARKQYEEAGDLLSRAQLHNDAAEAYARGGHHLKAARSFQASQNMAQAIHHYKQGGEYRQAAVLYARDGQHRAAAAEYMQAGDFAAAAEAYGQSGDDRRAAEAFERVGQHLKAAQCYERAEQELPAAQSYLRHLEGLLGKAGGDVQALGAERELAMRAGKLFRDAGELEQASRVFQSGGYWREAADCLRTSGDYTRAAEMLIERDQPLLAAQILEEAGEGQRAALMRAQQAERADDLATAAREYQRAGKTERAAKLYDQLGEAANAARLYEELEQWNRAMELFIESGLHGSAARCAERAQLHARAVELYERAGDVDGQLRAMQQLGDYFRAGRLLFEHRQYDQAIKILDLIDSREPLYPRALELQGDVVRAQGRFERAFSRYRAALGTRSADTETAPLFYKMARALEEMKDLNGAMQNYAILVEIDPHYEDAALRLKSIRDRQRRMKTTGGGLFSTHDLGGEGGKRYEIIDEIARGGMGIVYKAKDTVLGRVVAYKILGENLRDNETAVKYFLREARAAAALSHPNIVTIFDAGEQDGEFYMAMEYVEGTTLKELVRRQGALPNGQVDYIIANCCKALQYAHDKGIIHRDVKSGNVMITRDKTLKVMDFGLAKFLTEFHGNHTQQVGTPFYMSPEQIIGKSVDFRSDLYSLGCMAFECATGVVPFFKGDLSYHHIHTKPPAPSSINPALNKKLEYVILRLLEKDPDDRFQTAQETQEYMARTPS